jgi:hypothetical protein
MEVDYHEAVWFAHIDMKLPPQLRAGFLGRIAEHPGVVSARFRHE